ncbi:MAG TPA: LysM domain-containing protein, partial [Anaerolineae bacterium]|nr:LysM domain-containing protein [Anaerolineae bacterium]
MRKKLLLVLALVIVLSTLPAAALAAGWSIQGYHVVRPGESLYAIGRAYATRPEVIAAANGIANPNRLWVGQRLAIPVAPWSPIPPG